MGKNGPGPAGYYPRQVTPPAEHGALPYISPVSPLYLPCTSPVSPLYLPYISPRYAIFFGDLNYRIDLDGDRVRQMALNGELSGLREHDQLLLARRDKTHALAEYAEAELAFEPTYKYDVGTAIFDTSEKRRAPAWCDRVLWRVQDESKLEPKPEPTGQCLSRITPIWYGRHG